MMTSLCKSDHWYGLGKRTSCLWPQLFLVGKAKNGDEGSRKKNCVLVLVSLAAASSKTQLYCLASQFKKLFPTSS